MASREVERKLGIFRRRYRSAAFLSSLAAWTLPACLFVGLVVVAQRAGRLPLHPAWWIAAAALALLGWACIAAWRATPSVIQVALRLDHSLESRELLVAAVDAGSDSTHPLAREARRRAAGLLDGAEPTRLAPLTRWSGWRAAAVGLLILVAAPFVPLPLGVGEVRAGTPPEVADAGEALEERVDELAEGLAAESDEAREALAELEELAEKMQTAEIGSREEALVALDGIEEQLRSQAGDTGSEKAREQIRDALADLAEDPFTEELASAIDAADAAAIQESLAKMAQAMPRDRAEANARLDEMRRLADKLEQLAEALEAAGKFDEAAKLREVAEALKNYDLERATELMKDLQVAEACEAAGEQLGGELEQELAEAVNMARYLLNLDKLPSLEGGEEGEGGSGGPRPGNTSTNLEDDSHASGDPILRRRQTDEESKRAGRFEQLYDSHIIEAESWVDMQAQGRLGESGAFTEQQGRGMGSDEGVQTPAHVFGDAAAGAQERAAELERVPLGYRNLVQRYFDRGAEVAPQETTGTKEEESDE